MLEPDEEAEWLNNDVNAAREVLNPHPAESLEAYPVAKSVNNPNYESADLFEPVDVPDQSGLDDFAS